MEWRAERGHDIKPCKDCGGLADKEPSQKIRNYICIDCYAKETHD